MGWFTSREHKTKGDDDYKSKLGPTHTDTYHTNKQGKRDEPHRNDLKVSGPKYAPSMKDIQVPHKK